MSRELRADSRPWLLKMHGDAGKPTTIVLTTDDYGRLEFDYRSVLSVIEHSC